MAEIPRVKYTKTILKKIDAETDFLERRSTAELRKFRDNLALAQP